MPETKPKAIQLTLTANGEGFNLCRVGTPGIDAKQAADMWLYLLQFSSRRYADALVNVEIQEHEKVRQN